MDKFVLTGGPLGGQEVDADGWEEGEVRWFDQPIEDGEEPKPRAGYRNDPGRQCMFIGEEAANIE